MGTEEPDDPAILTLLRRALSGLIGTGLGTGSPAHSAPPAPWARPPSRDQVLPGAAWPAKDARETYAAFLMSKPEASPELVPWVPSDFAEWRSYKGWLHTGRAWTGQETEARAAVVALATEGSRSDFVAGRCIFAAREEESVRWWVLTPRRFSALETVARSLMGTPSEIATALLACIELGKAVEHSPALTHVAIAKGHYEVLGLPGYPLPRENLTRRLQSVLRVGSKGIGDLPGRLRDATQEGEAMASPEQLQVLQTILEPWSKAG
ncbi:MAG: hypothetical protein AAGF12_14345 [Myxococcota bacterium]